jgi:hypothetical protein
VTEHHLVPIISVTSAKKILILSLHARLQSDVNEYYLSKAQSIIKPIRKNANLIGITSECTELVICLALSLKVSHKGIKGFLKKQHVADIRYFYNPLLP